MKSISILAVTLLTTLALHGEDFERSQVIAKGEKTPLSSKAKSAPQPTPVAAKQQDAKPSSNENCPVAERPEPIHKNCFFINAEALYWKPHEDGLAYAVTSEAPAVASGVMAMGSVKEAEGKWAWGFRAGVGYRRTDEAPFREDRASSDVSVNWTYFHNNSKNETAVSNFAITGGGTSGQWVGDILLATFTTLGEFGFGPSATATWKLVYNTLDLEFARKFSVGKPFSFRPHFGLRGGSVYQKLNAVYVDYDTTYSSIATNYYFAKDDFLGAGVRAGANMVWRLGYHFGIFGNVSGSLIYGKFKLSAQIDETTNTGTSLFLTTMTTTYNLKAVQPNVDLGIGVMWEVWPDEDRRNITFAAAYELVEWFNQNRFYIINSIHLDSAITGIGPLQGNLCMQGLTLKARVDF